MRITGIRITAAMLLAAALLMPLVSCGTDTDNTDMLNQNTAEGFSAPNEAATERLGADVPEMDLGGRDFVILYCDHPIKMTQKRGM